MRLNLRPRRTSSLLSALIVLMSSLAVLVQASRPKPQQNAASETTRVEIAAADSMQRKIDFLKRNATITPADPRPTIFLQSEINAYFAQHRVKLPTGVMSVNFDLSPGLVNAKTRVDFDELTANKRGYNPLLAIFTGVHDVQVVATANGRAGTASVYVRSVTLDGVSVPRMALEVFIHKFVNPKYPSVSLDGEYHLPVRIDSVIIGDRRGTVAQK
jgi:hypothetical protein